MNHAQAYASLDRWQKDDVDNGRLKIGILTFSATAITELKAQLHAAEQMLCPEVDCQDVKARVQTLRDRLAQAQAAAGEPVVVLSAGPNARPFQAAHTPAEIMPPYLNATKADDGSVTITVRAPSAYEYDVSARVYGPTASITLSAADWAAWKADLERLAP